MTKLRLLTAVVGGPCEGSAGDVVEVDDETAKVWGDNFRAEYVDAPLRRGRRPRVETMMSSGGPENMAQR